MADAAQASVSTNSFLIKTLYVVFTRPVKPWEEIAAVLPEHLAYQVSLEQRGIMFGAGPCIGISNHLFLDLRRYRRPEKRSSGRCLGKILRSR